MSWNATCWPPVAASPECCDSALLRSPPVRPNTLTKAAGSVPPLLKKLLSALATFCGLAPAPGPPPGPPGLSVAVRFKITLAAV